MKRLIIGVAAVALLGMQARGEFRTWTVGGESVSAEYVKNLFDNVVLRNRQGAEQRIPLTELSAADRSYVELLNPPKLKVDFRESFKQDHIDESPFLAKPPPIVLNYRFGARVTQAAGSDYHHRLRIEVFAFTQQRYDPNKYHLIARFKSPPFELSEANKYRYQFMGPKTFRVIQYELDASFIGWRETRGEKISERLVLVRDERGKVIAYNSTKKWLYNHLDKLLKLPVGAWLDDTCTRVHPTSPKDTKSGVPPH